MGRGGFGQRKKRGGRPKKRRRIRTKSREIATIKGKKALKLDFSSFSSTFLGTFRGKIVESPSSGRPPVFPSDSFTSNLSPSLFPGRRRMCHPHNIFPSSSAGQKSQTRVYEERRNGGPPPPHLHLGGHGNSLP